MPCRLGFDAGPEHLENIAAFAVIHVAHARHRPGDRHVEAAVPDDRLVDMDADHLTKDVVPYMISKFGVSADPANWGVAGFSMGGTCAVTLAMKYPELFSAFIDIGGDLFPRDGGGRDETIERLFNSAPLASRTVA